MELLARGLITLARGVALVTRGSIALRDRARPAVSGNDHPGEGGEPGHRGARTLAG